MNWLDVADVEAWLAASKTEYRDFQYRVADNVWALESFVRALAAHDSEAATAADTIRNVGQFHADTKAVARLLVKALDGEEK